MLVLHHSHTDIGYTARQEQIARAHADFLRQALTILRRVSAGEATDQEGFRWQCENYWQIENFLSSASPAEADELVSRVREGSIGLSASYLNLTDLVDADVLAEHLRLARDWAEEIGAPMRCAMAADVNGYSAALPDALAQAGVRYFYSAVHTHHGMYPLYQNPTFFRWRGPKGGSVLVFSGEHYHWGHVLGLCPHGFSSYMMRDDVRRQMESGRLLTTDERTTEAEELSLACQRIGDYLDDLERKGWPLDFIPVFVSGVLSDNAPPNGRVAERVRRLNERMGDRVTLRMATLEDVFSRLEAAGVEIPEYAGDWTDWWADGVGSTPGAVQLYRQAQRNRRMATMLTSEGEEDDPALRASSGRAMMLFAEHTWGHSASVSDPYQPLVQTLLMKKTGYAIEAHNAASAWLDGALAEWGARSIAPDRSHRVRVINPWPFEMTAPAAALLQGWEYLDGCIPDGRALTLRDLRTGAWLPSQTGPGPRGRVTETVVTLGPGQSADLQLVYAPAETACPPMTCADGVDDLALDGEELAMPEWVDTPFFRVRMDPRRGVASIVERRTGQELVDPSCPWGAFTCVYERTMTVGSRSAFRRRMGRRRSTVNTRRYAAQPERFEITDQGPVSVTLRVDYRLEGAEECILLLKVYRSIPRIDARLRLRKTSCADPESVNIILPFVTDGDNETWIDKTGCVLRPGIDQLPGTCQAFWCLQNGVLRRGKSFDLLLGSPDVPLVSFGLEKEEPVALCDGRSLSLNRDWIVSRIMNNFWETNFNLDLSGWYEFSWHLLLQPPQSPNLALTRCEALNAGFPVADL